MPSKSSLQRQIFSSGNLNHAGMIGSDTKRGHIPETVVRYDPSTVSRPVRPAVFILLQALEFDCDSVKTLILTDDVC